MTLIQTNDDGTWLFEDGHLVDVEECCCDDCPHCPPIDQMPKFCLLKVTTPWGVIYYSYTTIAGQPTPDWTRLTSPTVPANECWYELVIPLHSKECVGSCENTSGVIPFLVPGGISGEVLCEGDDGENCDCGSGNTSPSRMEIRLIGGVQFAERHLLSNGVGEIRFRKDCTNNKVYRKLWFEYIHQHDLRGRHVGSINYKRFAVAGGDCTVDFLCSDTTIGFNEEDVGACEECPQFNWVAEEDHEAGFEWLEDGWNRIDAMGVGTFYSSTTGIKFREYSWVEVPALFGDDDVLPQIGCAPCLPYSEFGFLDCDPFDDETIGSVGDCVEFTFDPPDNWLWWKCDPDYFGGGAAHPFLADASFPPPGVTIETTPSPCPEGATQTDPVAYGDVYTSHHIEFISTTPPAACTVTHSPDEAVPCLTP